MSLLGREGKVLSPVVRYYLLVADSTLNRVTSSGPINKQKIMLRYNNSIYL